MRAKNRSRRSSALTSPKKSGYNAMSSGRARRISTRSPPRIVSCNSLKPKSSLSGIGATSSPSAGVMKSPRPLDHPRIGEERAQDQSEDDADHDGDDDDRRRIAERFVLRRFHQHGQPEPQQIKAVEAEDGQKAQARNEQENSAYPKRRVGIGRHLQRALEILAAGERRRQRIDNQRDHINGDEGEQIADDRIQ